MHELSTAMLIFSPDTFKILQKFMFDSEHYQEKTHFRIEFENIKIQSATFSKHAWSIFCRMFSITYSSNIKELNTYRDNLIAYKI